MKKAFFFLISILLLGNEVFCSSVDRINQLIEDCYSGSKINIEEILELQNTISKEDINEYILVHTVLSSVMPFLGNTDYKEKLETFEVSMKETIAVTKDEVILNLYANYIYSKFLWSKNTTSIIEELQSIYVRNALYNKNKKALLDMAVWYISAANSDTGVWTSFILEQEHLIEVLELTNVELYLAFISYSMFYMKTYNTGRAFEYLEKAKSIFANGILTAIIEENYKNGKIGY